ncbi:MAG: molybdopterin-dependent oxidoreductase [Candidatus Methylomirabilales bacterium]
MSEGVNRRQFLKMVGVGGATATLAACTSEPPEKLIPYLIPPEEIIPGEAVWYATTCRECPAGCGMLVRTREGRAVKVEGSPQHPVNTGRLCARGQASLQGLYNPDRIYQPLLRNDAGQLQPTSWEEAEKLLAARLTGLVREKKADGIAMVTPVLTGSLDRLVQTWLAYLGSGRRLAYEAFSYESLRAANRITFGQDAFPDYDIEAADLLLSFGADFLETWISPVAYARGFAAMRTYRNGRMGTFLAVEPRLSLTAANADEWIPIKPGTEVFLALGMIHVMLAEGLVSSLPQEEMARIQTLVEAYEPEMVARHAEVPTGTIFRLARAFARAKPGLALGGGVAGTGSNATATLVAINLLNYVAGNVGKTVRFGSNASLSSLATYHDMLNLIEAINGGEVQALLLCGVNPAFTLPEAAGFRAALRKVPLVVSFSSFMDETTAQAHLVLPDHTPLESWGDYSPWEGIHGLVQPVMRPLFQTKAMGDVLLSVAKQIDEAMARAFPWQSFYEYLRDQWKEIHQRFAPQKDFETFWEEALRQGGVWEPVEPGNIRLELRSLLSTLPSRIEESGFDGDQDGPVLFPYPSLVHFDGRGANRSWLQELPDPMTQIVWDNWLEIHTETAHRLGITEGELVEVASHHGKVELPAHLSKWIHPDSVAIPIGQGHAAFGRYAEKRGANPLSLLPSKSEPVSGGLVWLSTRVALTRTGKRHTLASVAGSDRQEGREVARAVALTEVGRLSLQQEKGEAHESKQMYPAHEHPEHRWGMAIDLNACIGCSACVVACYAENNIPVVGKELVGQGREMAWIQIQRYFGGTENRPETRLFPMLCQQCDAAPCESVCPVYATYHNKEGLNAQVYNRCVGVRYCSNNCPYKVRRFNWFEYEWPEPLHWQLNPDVTVRSMGIMEKCTFCVQRIREAKDRAKNDVRAVQDGEITPACAQTCPTHAIVFGDLKDPNSEVSKLSRDPRGYRALEHLGTIPAITYLRKITQDSERV